jgi:hypothetical protein
MQRSQPFISTVCADKSAPFSRSTRTASTTASSDARCNGVHACSALAVPSSPCGKKIRATSPCPPSTAKLNGPGACPGFPSLPRAQEGCERLPHVLLSLPVARVSSRAPPALLHPRHSREVYVRLQRVPPSTRDEVPLTCARIPDSPHLVSARSSETVQ